MPLFGKDSGHSVLPHLFHGAKDPQLVVHDDVVIGRIPLLDIVELLFFMNVN